MKSISAAWCVYHQAWEGTFSNSVHLQDNWTKTNLLTDSLTWHIINISTPQFLERALLKFKDCLWLSKHTQVLGSVAFRWKSSSRRGEADEMRADDLGEGFYSEFLPIFKHHCRCCSRALWKRVRFCSGEEMFDHLFLWVQSLCLWVRT